MFLNFAGTVGSLHWKQPNLNGTSPCMSWNMHIIIRIYLEHHYSKNFNIIYNFTLLFMTTLLSSKHQSVNGGFVGGPNSPNALAMTLWAPDCWEKFSTFESWHLETANVNMYILCVFTRLHKCDIISKNQSLDVGLWQWLSSISNLYRNTAEHRELAELSPLPWSPIGWEDLIDENPDFD